MPDLLTINRDQRDGLYELVRNHLGSIEDFWVALERTRDYETAQRLGAEFGDDFMLLRSIGWRPIEAREVYALTMPRQDLIEVLRRLHGEAAQVLLGSAAESSREDSETDQRFQVGYETCGTVLADLDQQETG